MVDASMNDAPINVKQVRKKPIELEPLVHSATSENQTKLQQGVEELRNRVCLSSTF